VNQITARAVILQLLVASHFVIQAIDVVV